jgi:hypothetical protein
VRLGLDEATVRLDLCELSMKQRHTCATSKVENDRLLFIERITSKVVRRDVLCHLDSQRHVGLQMRMLIKVCAVRGCHIRMVVCRRCIMGVRVIMVVYIV